MEEVSFIEHMSVLDVKDGDAIVLKVNQPLSRQQEEMIVNRIKQVVDPHNERGVGVLVLGEGMELGVLNTPHPSKPVRDVL
ncbi:hypothetical protein P4V43_20725 [Brevibacillus fortis]|uniref:hypothetical protein n=1 Tax=Brevibacillus fortis TaxID=2126352 RepID=UPI002E229941|nr:hypothetical protein [Brevibacillus fortis]